MCLAGWPVLNSFCTAARFGHGKTELKRRVNKPASSTVTPVRLQPKRTRARVDIKTD